MPLTLKVTRGYTAVDGVPLDYDDLNAGFLPTIQVEGQIENADISNCAVTASKVKPGAYFWGTATIPVSANAIVVTTTCGLAALETGSVIAFKAAGTNTSTVTVNVDGLGVKDLRKYGTTALGAGDIRSGAIYVIRYDGTYWQLISPTATTLDSNGGADPSGAANTPNTGTGPHILSNTILVAQGTCNTNTMNNTDTKLGEITFTMPSGASTWLWVELFFKTFLNSTAGNLAGIDTFHIKLSGTEQTGWVDNFLPYIANNSDDCVEISVRTEGVPSTVTGNITLEVYAKYGDTISFAKGSGGPPPTGAANQGDDKYQRTLYGRAYYK